MSKDKALERDALEYHEASPQGKLTVVPTKPHSTQRELSLAYSPGVAYPCLEIEKDAANAYRYTAKGNLVAVISNDIAVLGLGNIGALAGKPVMEGKGLLFKAFADIDVFDIEVDSEDIDEFVQDCKEYCTNIWWDQSRGYQSPRMFRNREASSRRIGYSCDA